MSISTQWRNKRIRDRKQQIADWNMEKNSIQALEDIRQEKQQIYSNKTKTTTTKAIITFLFVNCSVIEIYALIMMAKLQDLSALSILITAIVGEVVGFAIYAIKSMKENSSGGITYLKAEHDICCDESQEEQER